MSLQSMLTALADSIRAKSGTTGLLGLNAMKTAVDGIQTAKEEQEKTVSPSTLEQRVIPDSGKVLNAVTVEAVTLQEKTVSAELNGSYEATPDSGYLGISKVTFSVNVAGGGLSVPNPVSAGDTPVLLNTSGIIMERLEAVAATGIALTVPVSGTYRFKTGVSNLYTAESSWGQYYSAIQLYRNNIALSDTYRTMGGGYIGEQSFDVECQAGDTIEIYASSADSTYKTLILFLAACINWNNGFTGG